MNSPRSGSPSPSTPPSRPGAAALDARIVAAMSHIEAHLGEPPTGAALAARSELSEFHFNRLFRAQTGETLAGYSRRIRLDNAAIRLHGSAAPVRVIAQEMGYRNQAAFTRAFGAHFGMTPQAWRRAGWLREPFTSPEPSGAAHPISLRGVPRIQTVMRRYFGPYENIGKNWGHFVTSLPEVLTREPGTLYLGLVRDDPRVTPVELIRYDCCVAPTLPALLDHPSVDALLALPGFARASTRPGRYASLLHHAEYLEVGVTHDLLFNWSRSCRYSMTNDPSIEVYTEPPPATLEGTRKFTMLYPVE